MYSKPLKLIVYRSMQGVYKLKKDVRYMQNKLYWIQKYAREVDVCKKYARSTCTDIVIISVPS